jgi:nickel-dependent lactate racemase
MSEITLKYGSTLITAALSQMEKIDWVLPPSISAENTPLTLVKQALDRCLGNIHAEKLNSSATVAIAINDKTRPVPHSVLLPPLLDWLRHKGILPVNIQFIIATGTHTPTKPEEYSLVLPDNLSDLYKMSSHNCKDDANLVHLGETKENHTPVLVNKDFYAADYRIIVGNIEPHHFMGFSGGHKTASIGLTGMATIQANHSLLPHPNCTTGRYEDNPMRQDVEEIGKMIGVDLALNAILNDHREIIEVLAGDPIEVIKSGIPVCQKVCQVPVSHQYDLVVASAGGYPKDINFYQAQKAMTHAAMITKDNGVLILAAECRDGSGSAGFESFMKGTSSPLNVLHKWSTTPFQIGPHKAFLTARILSRINVILVSNISPEIVRSWYMTPANSLQDALSTAKEFLLKQSIQPTIAVIPNAVNTISLLPLA